MESGFCVHMDRFLCYGRFYLPVPLSMEFPRQDYWSGLPFPSPGDVPNPGIEPASPHCSQNLCQLSYPGKCITVQYYIADCVSWAPRLTLLDLRTNCAYICDLRTELICIRRLTVLCTF